MNDKEYLNLDILDTDVFSPEYFTKEFREYVFNCMKSEYNSIMLDSITRLREDIKSIDTFFRWNKTKEKCFSWNVCPFSYLIPTLFASSKEAWYWKRKETRKIQIADVENINFSDLYIIEWPSDLTKLDILCEIRDAIEHKRIVYNKNNVIMVDNPNVPRKHPYEFKAVIPNHVLYDFINIVANHDRRIHADIFIYRNDLNYNQLPDDNPENAIYDWNFYQIMLKDSANRPLISDWPAHEIYDFYRNHTFSADHYDVKKINLTENQKEIISDFFSKNKHKLDSTKLQYIASNLIDHNAQEQFYITLLSSLWCLKPTDTYQEFMNESFNKICLNNNIWTLSAKYWWNTDKQDIVKTIYDWLLKEKQKNWQPLIWHTNWIFKYAHDKIKKMWFIYDENKWEFTNWNTTFTTREFAMICGNISTIWVEFHYLFDEFPNWLRLQYIKLVYTTILSNTANWNSNDSWNTVRTRAFTEEERIRDAMVHNQYTHLHWVKNIIMRDWYDKRSNSWNWEKVYNLKDLYDDSYKKFKDYIEH